MSILFLFLFIASFQKEVKRDILLNQIKLLDLYPDYDYLIYLYTSRFSSETIYFLIETKLNTMPLDIAYSLRDSNDTSIKNISIYHEEQKGNLNAFFFKIDIPHDVNTIIDLNVTNIRGHALLGCSEFEELNSNFMRIEDATKEIKLQIYKNRTLILLYNSLLDYSFQITVPSFQIFKTYIPLYFSNKNINDIFIISKEFVDPNSVFTIYDNKTYELYRANVVSFPKAKSKAIIVQPLMDANITFQTKNFSYLACIQSVYDSYDIGYSHSQYTICKQLLYRINCSNYHQDLFYFTMKKYEDYMYPFNFFYSDEVNSNLDIIGNLELKNATCKSKGIYIYCEMNRTSPEQKNFYFVVDGQIRRSNAIDIRSTFFDESNYKIQEPYSSYEYKIDNNKKPNLPIVIGDFEFNEKFYFELEIDFLENNINNNVNDNNIKNINIYVKILNQKADSYLEFPLENKGVSLITKISNDVKSYYLYESKNSFTSGIKSLFFFVNHRGNYPNCTIKYGTYRDKPVRYDNNSMFLNEEKSFTNKYEIFYLIMDLTQISLFSNDIFYIKIRGKKDAFISNKVTYRLESNIANNNINGNYSVSENEVKEEGEEKIITCFIPNKSTTKYLNLILNLNKDSEINVNVELIYKGNFVDSLSCTKDRKYIISNNASENGNYYIFISPDTNFNIDGFSYNTIDSLDNFTESYPIREYREVMGNVDKRVYININNEENKNFIGFKTEKTNFPFKIIKTKINEFNTQFVNYTQKFSFNLTKNNPLLFVFNFAPKHGLIYIKFSSNLKLDYFNHLTYFINYPEFQSFSDICYFHKLDEDTIKIFYEQNKTIIFTENYIRNFFYGMFTNQTIEGELEIELLYNNITRITIDGEITYNLNKGINLISTNINKYSRYNFILKQSNQLNSDNFEIYNTDKNNFTLKKTFINKTSFEYQNDTYNNSYLYFTFLTKPYLIIFSDSSAIVTLRQSGIKENDIDRYYNLDEKTITVKNTNKIVLIGGINMNDSTFDSFYFKYTIESIDLNKLNTTYYIDDESNPDNIVDFYNRERPNIFIRRYIKYGSKIDIYLETYGYISAGNKTAIFMFDYYNNNQSLIVNLFASKKSLITSHYLNKLENSTYEIFNKVFLLYLYPSDFKDLNNDYILFEINGNMSAFNSNQIYINEKNNSNTEIFNEFNNCNKKYYQNELTISCNYTKPYKDTARFMLLLNQGNEINLKNIIPDKKEIPTDEERKDESDRRDGRDDNKSLKYFLYIGIPIIVIVLGAIMVIIIIKCKKKKLSLDDSAKMIDTELIPKNE